MTELKLRDPLELVPLFDPTRLALFCVSILESRPAGSLCRLGQKPLDPPLRPARTRYAYIHSTWGGRPLPPFYAKPGGDRSLRVGLGSNAANARGFENFVSTKNSPDETLHFKYIST